MPAYADPSEPLEFTSLLTPRERAQAALWILLGRTRHNLRDQRIAEARERGRRERGETK